MLCLLHTAVRVYLLVLGAFIGFIAICIQLVASASFSFVGNDNALSRSIPDWPDSLVLFIVGALMLGVAALKCVLGLCGIPTGVAYERGGCRCEFCGPESVLCNSACAFIGAIVLASFVISGSHFLSDDAWGSIRGQAAQSAGAIRIENNGTITDLQAFATGIFQQSVLAPVSMLLVIGLAGALAAEAVLVCCLREEKAQTRALLREKGIQLAENDAESPPTNGRAPARGTIRDGLRDQSHASNAKVKVSAVNPPDGAPQTSLQVARSDDGQLMASAI